MEIFCIPKTYALIQKKYSMTKATLKIPIYMH